MILVKKLKFFHLLCLSKIYREKVFADVRDKEEAFKEKVQKVTGGFKGLLGVTRGCKRLQEATGGYKGLQGVTRG